MPFSMKRDLDSQTKLFTALGFGDKQISQPFLDSVRGAAYAHRTDNISLDSLGKAVVRSVVDGKTQDPTVIDFSDSEVSLPKSMDYNVKVNDGGESHVSLSASLFGGQNSFVVHAADKVIEGSCSTKNGISECDQTIKDAAGHLLLQGHTVTDITRNPADFRRTSDFKSAANESLGTFTQHVVFDKTTNVMTAETSLARRER